MYKIYYVPGPGFNYVFVHIFTVEIFINYCVRINVNDILIHTSSSSVYVVNIQIQYEIFICVEGGISDPNLEAG